MVEKLYYYSLIFTDIIRPELEEEMRDFYLPITKNSMEKHKFYKSFKGKSRVLGINTSDIYNIDDIKFLGIMKFFDEY